MYVREQHIEVQLSMQKIASNRTRKLMPEEIDWLLNKNQERLIRSKVTPRKDGSGGFEILQDDLDAVKTLVKRGVVLPAYTNGARTVRCALPGDYSYLTQDESSIKRIPLTGAAVPTSTDQTLQLLQLPFRKSTKAQAPYYQTVNVAINGNSVFNLQQFTSDRDTNYQGLSSPDQIFVLPGFILQALIDQGWEAYWEYYQDKYYPRSFLIVGRTALTGAITIDSTVLQGVSSTVNVRVRDLPSVTSQYQANRLTASNIVSSLLEVAFFGTQPEFPISELSDRSLYVYPNETFIVSNTIISYVRKPRRISLILGSDSELSPEYHQLICDLTVEYIKGMIADPNWEVKLKDNMTRTTLTP